ncbi:MAG: hypothetical protein M3O67_03150 [Bacteroidota bacterium]|nr:hypothetical protein [Bacteroidota bacterium]
MKTKIKNHRTLATALIAFSLLFSTAALANGGGKDTAAVEFKFLGNVNNQSLFKLDLSNPEKVEYTITLKDKEGVVIYSDRVTEKNITRTFKLNPDEIEENPVTVVIKAKNSNKPEVYEISSISRLVQETYVSKL